LGQIILLRNARQMVKIAACIALLYPFCLLRATEAQRYQLASVSQIDKTPCFSVADTAETRAAPVELAVLEVNQINDGKYTPVWSIEFLKDSPASQLSPSVCIPYGHADAASMKVRKPAQLLQPHQAYSFFFNAFVAKEQGKGFVNRVYRGNFCIVLDAQRQPKVRQVVYDAASGEWLWNACNIK
jgi:hypothetical protein